jgi:hypothetical protein
MSLLRRTRKSPAERAVATIKSARTSVKIALIAIPVVAAAAITALRRRRKPDFGGINDGAESHQPPVQAAQHAAVS